MQANGIFWNTRRIETSGKISHGWFKWFKQKIMLRLCSKKRLDEVVDYDKCEDICTLTEARYAPTHARVNNHRPLSVSLWGVNLKKLIVVKILHIMHVVEILGNLIRVCDVVVSNKRPCILTQYRMFAFVFSSSCMTKPELRYFLPVCLWLDSIKSSKPLLQKTPP